ncbi:MAG: TSUP family transporter [Arenicella sp.]|jgi:uncharacterized membrane protein YfcA|nr:TSUP family transporter [Arenicella sp.]HAU68287.1 hypothetical protein [Gammaproteobacteria bacterium]
MAEISGLEITLFTAVLLFLAAFVAGYIDTLVGGGGLITIPALLAVGVPPLMALGTNKLQAVGGSGTSTITLLMRKQYRIQDIAWLIVSAFVGSVIGTIIIQFVDAKHLEFLIPCVIVVIALYFTFSPKASTVHREPRISRKTYGLTAVPLIGSYDGMLGPGTGSFFVLAGTSLRGQDIVTATKHAKPLNFATNLASLIVFIWYAKVIWAIGGLMWVGQFLGARMGSNKLMTVDPSILRYLVLVLCGVMLVSLYWR